MGNRRHHKKLRAEARARMAKTGESYQKALAQVAQQRSQRLPVDLVPIEYFGMPATLATYDLLGRLACVVVSSGHRPTPFPSTPLHALVSRTPRLVH